MLTLVFRVPWSALGQTPQAPGPDAPGLTGQPGEKPAPPPKPLPAVGISSSVDRVEVPARDTLRYTVTIEWEEPAGGQKHPLDFEFPEPPSAEGMVLFANSFRSTTELRGGVSRVKRIYDYDFSAEKQGKTSIKPVMVKYSWLGAEEKKDLSTQPIAVTVTRARFRIMDDLGKRGATLVVLAILVGVIAYAVWDRVRTGRKDKAEVVHAPSPYEAARDSLVKADRLRMAGDYAGFLGALASVIKVTMETALELRVKAGGPAESFSDSRGPEWKERLEQFEKLADKARFAGYQPTARELDESMATAKELVELAGPVNKKEE